jgi:hypothetical protein
MSRTVLLIGGILLLIGSLALGIASWAGAQENLEKGKTAAQLYANDCAICHKSPQSVPRTTGIFGLENFLREHYAASAEAAAAIATYLNGLERRAKPVSQSKTPAQAPKGRGPRPVVDTPRPPANLNR